MPISVFIVEDHPIQRDTLLEYIDFTDGLELCGVASSGEEALEKLESLRPSVLVTDLALPGMSGLALVEQIKARRDLPCLFLSGHGEHHHVSRALDAGADGYVLKGKPRELSTAIQAIVAGERFISESLGFRPDAEQPVPPPEEREDAW
jgi:DNA-binding NarL/FixJ family response regulator